MHEQYLLLFIGAEKKKKKGPAETQTWVWEAQNVFPKCTLTHLSQTEKPQNGAFLN